MARELRATSSKWSKSRPSRSINYPAKAQGLKRRKYMRLVVNPVSSRSAYEPAEAEIVSYQRSEEALSEIETWDGYAPTPLRDLPALAARLGLGEVYYKDESGRLGQGSFKILGGAYAAELALREAMQDGVKPTLCCATDGNHGLGGLRRAQARLRQRRADARRRPQGQGRRDRGARRQADLDRRQL